MISLEANGFEILRGVVREETVEGFLAQLAMQTDCPEVRQKNGETFGIRNLFAVLPSARELALSSAFAEIVREYLGEGFRLVRGLFFDKTPGANWNLNWHQDRTIAVQERVEVEGYAPFTEKAGVLHVQPPAGILERMLTLRVFLDDADEQNGALEVLPGSHRSGKLSASEIECWTQSRPTYLCSGKRGDLLLMKPLLLHRSSPSQRPGHRRVLHFDYAAAELAGCLQWKD